MVDPSAMTRSISELRQFVMGFRNTQLLYVAAKLDIADRLARGPKSSQTLAEETGADADALYRVLRALATLGIMAQLPDERFTLTDAGQLKPAAPPSMCLGRRTSASGVSRRPGSPGRATFIAGDFFDSVPDGSDLYTLKSVLHDWDDDAAIDILRACRRAIPRTGRLLVIEHVITDAPSSAEAKLFDINMLVVLGGRERTEREYKTLLTAAAFIPLRLMPTASPMTHIGSNASRRLMRG